MVKNVEINEETSNILLADLLPETKEEALARNDENGVFEFSITGRNTSEKPIYYEIDLLEGDVVTGENGVSETVTKILPEHVMIYWTEMLKNINIIHSFKVFYQLIVI